MVQFKTQRAFFIFGIIDIAVGVCGVLFCFLSGFLYEGFRFLALFGGEFWAFIALPLLLLACGIMIVFNTGNRSVFSAFISLIAAIYLAASIFSTTPPSIVNVGKISPVILEIVMIFLPVAGAVFFILQACLSFFNRKFPAGS